MARVLFSGKKAQKLSFYKFFENKKFEIFHNQGLSMPTISNLLFKSTRYWIGILFIFFIAFINYKQGEKYFYLIVLMCVPIYHFICVMMLILTAALAHKTFKFRNVNLNYSNKFFQIYTFIDYMAVTFFLSYGVMSSKMFLMSLILLLYSLISFSFFVTYMIRKLYTEAKKQNIDLSKETLLSLFFEMRAEVLNIINSKKEKLS
jgi:hypothetical protein